MKRNKFKLLKGTEVKKPKIFRSSKEKEEAKIKKILDDNTRVALAVKIGKTRLIDNMNLKGN